MIADAAPTPKRQSKRWSPRAKIGASCLLLGAAYVSWLNFGLDGEIQLGREPSAVPGGTLVYCHRDSSNFFDFSMYYDDSLFIEDNHMAAGKPVFLRSLDNADADFHRSAYWSKDRSLVVVFDGYGAGSERLQGPDPLSVGYDFPHHKFLVSLPDSVWRRHGGTGSQVGSGPMYHPWTWRMGKFDWSAEDTDVDRNLG